MTYLRGTTFNQHSAAQLEWTQPAALPAPAHETTPWISGFVRALWQTLSPSALRGFFRDLDAKDALLSRLGWSLMAVVPLFAALALLVPAAFHGINPWIKPIKFSLSFSTFATTISIFLLPLRIPSWQLKFARWVIAVSVAFEIFSLATQAWRSIYATGSHSLLDSFLAQMTNSMVMINTLIVTAIFGLLCARRVHSSMVDSPMLAALRYSLVIFLAGNAVGGYMLARGSHTVGARDGGPGLPFVNWSTIAGDLRIAHFIAIHAIQIIPVFAWVLAQMAPVTAVKQRKLAVSAFSILVACAVGLTFVQAAMGRPLLPLSLLGK
ncbi:MAG TPA: hypothetical protein VKQ89_02535 [Candidatus Angelobacter sp.]|nr:hypothetical protein [Candidatus Angelobacter sp.]